jgi:transcriptional antiterminator RfaH
MLCARIALHDYKAGVQKKSRTPLFPGYLFVSFDPANASWSTINNTCGIARLILNHPHKPSPLPSSLMAGLKARCDADGLLLPPPP